MGFYTSRGVILITVLIFLLAITTLTLSSVSTVQTTIKLQHQIEQREKLFQTAELGLRNVEKLIPTTMHKACYFAAPLVELISNQTSNDLFCTMKINENIIHYAIEVLNQNPCAIVEEQRGAIFYQVSVKAEEPNTQTAVILQSIYVLPWQNPNLCTNSNTFLTVKKGRVSWREVVD